MLDIKRGPYRNTNRIYQIEDGIIDRNDRHETENLVPVQTLIESNDIEQEEIGRHRLGRFDGQHPALVTVHDRLDQTIEVKQGQKEDDCLDAGINLFPTIDYRQECQQIEQKLAILHSPNQNVLIEPSQVGGNIDEKAHDIVGGMGETPSHQNECVDDINQIFHTQTFNRFKLVFLAQSNRTPQ